ncbi:DUF1449 family protein, partial [bacterium]|nr:DUF1449 family protein [bacterium]
IMAELLHWWNLIYVLAFFLALFYIVLNSIGLISEGGDVDVHADADLDHDFDMGGVDHDVDMHVDIGHDVHFGHDVDVDHDVGDMDHDVSVEPSFFEEALSFFGIGRLPLSIILMTFLLTFAIVGWAVNLLLKDVLGGPAFFFPISLAAAIFCGLSGTKLLAGTLGKYLRPIESAATSRRTLEGKIATAALPVTAEFGQALVRDDHGSLHKVVCRVEPGAETIPKGQTVLLVNYVHGEGPMRLANGYYIVEAYDVPGQ